MARSCYIYAATVSSQIEPVAAFTVKHELRSWLSGLERTDDPLLSGLRVFRMDDGPGGMKSEMVIDDIINGR